MLILEKLTILVEYSDFADIFSKEVVAKLLKHSDINNYLINLEPSKQLPYDLTYNLEPVKLKTLKFYFKINLVNSFIWLFKSHVGSHILFIQKSDNSFYICVDY